MVWVFAVLVVLLLGAVAVLAAGRGQDLQPVFDDRPDVGVPEEGELTAADLRRVRFPLALRGYRMDDVDALLDRLAREREAHEHFRAPSVAETGDEDDRRDPVRGVGGIGDNEIRHRGRPRPALDRGTTQEEVRHGGDEAPDR